MISTVYIAKNVYGGDGLGRLGDGRVVFVPGAWAGEQVKAEIVEEKKHFVKAVLKEVVEASPHRITPAPSVPGMVYSGLAYPAELDAKEQQLREFFERTRIALPESGIERLNPDPKPTNYRNKVVYHFAKYGDKWRIGYRTEPSHEIIDVTEDPLARPEINQALGGIRQAVLSLLTTGPINVRKDTERKANLTIRWTKKSGVKWYLGEAPKDLSLKETTCGLDFEVPAGGFYQVNPEVGEALVKDVTSAIHGSPRILDLYCGVGVFGLSALKANPTASLIGIESGRQAIDFAKRNASSQKAANAKFFAEEVGRNLRRIPIGAETTVIIDPPRDGLERGVAQWLSASRAPKIIYVSCDPATLMRDLRSLTPTYRVSQVKWYNMFPRTARFETCVVLTRTV